MGRASVWIQILRCAEGVGLGPARTLGQGPAQARGLGPAQARGGGGRGAWVRPGPWSWVRPGPGGQKIENLKIEMVTSGCRGSIRLEELVWTLLAREIGN